MNKKQQEFELYLDEKIAACKQRSKQLTADDRTDEGNFEKVRANVYEIFKTILSVAEKVCKEDELAKVRSNRLANLSTYISSTARDFNICRRDLSAKHLNRLNMGN